MTLQLQENAEGKFTKKKIRLRVHFLGKDTCGDKCHHYDSSYNLLPDIAPTIGDVFKAKKTCAIVTYSKCLYQHSYGSLIDSNDVVLRFNLHPCENATDHGTKTTHMMVNLWEIRGTKRFSRNGHF